MIILTIVFSSLFEISIDNFPTYVLCGRLIFDFFSQSTTASLNSIISSGHIISKVYVPKYIITLSKIISNFLFFMNSLVILIIIMLFTKAEFTLNILYAPLYFILLFLFCCGVGLILATITVFFRDMEHIYGVLTTALMYATAIFYPADIIPEKYQFVLTLNPIYYYVEGFREVVYLGNPIDIQNMLICLALGTISLVVGIIVFERNQDKFILHL